MTSNRNPIKRWFATFPNSCQSHATKLSFECAFPPSEFYTCCEEDHKSGKKHLHACVLLKKPLSKAKLLKYLEKTYPVDVERIHLRAVRDLDNAIDYIKKEDPEYVCIGQDPKKKAYSSDLLKLEQWFIANGYWDKNHRQESEQRLRAHEKWLEEQRLIDLEFTWKYTDRC